MFTTQSLPVKPLLQAVVALAIAGASGTALAADPVRASFDRMLAVEAAPTLQAAAPRDECDPLVAAIVVPLRDGWAGRVPVVTAGPAADPVAEGFARMLNHEPSRFAPTRPEGLGADPLIAAIVLTLLQSHQIEVAASAPVARR